LGACSFSPCFAGDGADGPAFFSFGAPAEAAMPTTPAKTSRSESSTIAHPRFFRMGLISLTIQAVIVEKDMKDRVCQNYICNIPRCQERLDLPVLFL
jgi:hypothetical protein